LEGIHISTIVKVYSFLNNITLDASEINRNFDDLYTTINNLNSENIINTYSIAASQVSFTDSNSIYSATNLNDALLTTKYVQKGYNTIHVMPDGTGAVQVWPGKVDINGKICTVSTKFTVSGLTSIDGGTGQSGLYFMCGQPAAGEEITASDIFLAQVTSITTSGNFTLSQNGYYYANKRLIGAAYCPDATCQNLMNYYNPDPPSKRFIYTPTSQTGHGLFGWTAGANAVGVTKTYINLARITYNRDHGAFEFAARLVLNEETSVQTEYLNHLGGGVGYIFTINTTQCRVSFGDANSSALVVPTAGVGLIKRGVAISFNITGTQVGGVTDVYIDAKVVR